MLFPALAARHRLKLRYSQMDGIAKDLVSGFFLYDTNLVNLLAAHSRDIPSLSCSLLRHSQSIPPQQLNLSIHVNNVIVDGVISTVLLDNCVVCKAAAYCHTTTHTPQAFSLLLHAPSLSHT